MFCGGADTRQEMTMGLLDVLNGMQNGPRGPSNPSAQSGGMSPMTMAILGLLAWKAVKHLTAGQPGAAPSAPAPAPTPSGNATAGPLRWRNGSRSRRPAPGLSSGRTACRRWRGRQRDQRRPWRSLEPVAAEGSRRHCKFVGQQRPQQGDFHRAISPARWAPTRSTCSRAKADCRATNCSRASANICPKRSII